MTRFNTADAATSYGDNGNTVALAVIDGTTAKPAGDDRRMRLVSVDQWEGAAASGTQTFII